MDNKEILNDGDIHKDSDDELIFNPYNSNNIEICLLNVLQWLSNSIFAHQKL